MRGRQLAALAVTAFLLAAGVVVVSAAQAAAHPGPPSSLFDRNEVAWDVVTGGHFDDEVELRRRQQLMVIDVEVGDPEKVCYRDRLGNERPVVGFGVPTALFQRNVDGRNWRLHRGLTAQQLTIANLSAHFANLRLVDLEIHDVDTDRNCKPDADPRYTALYIENREGYDVSWKMGLSSDKVRTYLAEQRDRGMMPIDVDQYRSDRTGAPDCLPCYTVIWVENREGLAWHLAWGLSEGTFVDRFNELKTTHRMIAVQSVGRYDYFGPILLGWKQQYSGIWLENRNGRGWAELRDMTERTLPQPMEEYQLRDYRPIAFERYHMEGGEDDCPIGDDDCTDGFQWKYAVIWRQN